MLNRNSYGHSDPTNTNRVKIFIQQDHRKWCWCENSSRKLVSVYSKYKRTLRNAPVFTGSPELRRQSFQPSESSPQFSKLGLICQTQPKRARVNVFTGNVPMLLRDLTQSSPSFTKPRGQLLPYRRVAEAIKPRIILPSLILNWVVICKALITFW